MLKENWIKSDLLPCKTKKYSISEILNQDGKLKITLISDETNECWLLTFEKVFFYRNMDESFWFFLPGTSQDIDGEMVWFHTVFQVTNSSLIQRLKEEMLEMNVINETESLQHFVILGLNEAIDIISASMPIVEKVIHAN